MWLSEWRVNYINGVGAGVPGANLDLEIDEVVGADIGWRFRADQSGPRSWERLDITETGQVEQGLPRNSALPVPQSKACSQ